MLNSDINTRFQDWLLNPTETLDFEVKKWLDLENDAEARGTVAKALIALENHGGGFLLIGFKETDDKRLIPDPARPASLEQYGPDAINAILKKCAEPLFHADVTFQTHSESGEEFPLIQVRGASKSPVRSCSATPGNSLRENLYYIRRPGPASEPPRQGVEWNQLIHRCVLNQRGEIVAMLRSFIPNSAGGNIEALVDERAHLSTFTNAAFAKWTALNDALPKEHGSKIRYGTFSFSCQILGNSKNLQPVEILKVVEGAKKYTGWPIYVVLHQDNNKPYLSDGALEASLIDLKGPDPGHADFWRIHPDGLFYSLRGYQEDALANVEGGNARAPSTGLEVSLPAWRVGEFLLRTEEIARAMFEDGFSMLVSCEWNGLVGRELFSFNNRLFVPGNYVCKENIVRTEETLPQAAVSDLLPDAVKKLTAPLYQHFGFFQPDDQFYEQELQRLRKG